MSQSPPPPSDPVARLTAAMHDEARVLLEGFHPLKHALRFDGLVEVAITPDPSAVLALARELAPDLVDRLETLLETVPAAAFARFAPKGLSSPVLAVARRPAIVPHDGFGAGPIVLLDRPVHLGNVGAVVRVAAGLGAAAVLTTGPLDPWHRSALRGSAGLHFALPVMRLTSLPADRPLVAFDPSGEPLSIGVLPVNAVLAFGSERRGLAHELIERADRCIAIPMRPGVSSLNLATAVAIGLWSLASTRPRPLETLDLVEPR